MSKIYLKPNEYEKFRDEYPDHTVSELVAFMRNNPRLTQNDPPHSYLSVQQPKPKPVPPGSVRGRKALRAAVSILRECMKEHGELYPHVMIRAFDAMEKYYKSRGTRISILSSAIWFVDLTERQDIAMGIDECHPHCIGGELVEEAIYLGMEFK